MKSLLRNIFAGAIALTVIARLDAQTPLSFTPKESKELTANADIWINGGQPEKTNIPYGNHQDSFSGRYLQIVYPSSDQKEFSALYRFNAKETGQYQFYAALIRQGTPFSSPVKFRFDGGEWKNIAPFSGPRATWGQSSALTWESLGQLELTAGSHTLEFFFNTKATNGNWSFMCDGIIGFNNTAYAKCKVDQLTITGKATPGQPLEFKFRTSGGSCLAEASVCMGEETISRQMLLLKPGQQTQAIALSGFMGHNNYKLKITPIAMPEKIMAETSFAIPLPEKTITPAQLKVVAQNNKYRLELNAPQDTVILAMLFVKDQLQEVDTIPVKAGTGSLEYALSDKLKQAAAGHDAKLRFLACPGQPENQPELNLTLPGMPKAVGLPLNYGIFTDRNNQSHPWYINRQYQYIFDGKPYVPFGGMWCPSTLLSKSGKEEEITRNLTHDRETMKALLANGLDDVYLNMSHMAPLWVRQHFIDMLEENKINYGYQLNGGGGAPIPSFFITRDRADAPKNWKSMIHGTYARGQINLDLPKDYKVLGMLIVPAVTSPETCEMLSFNDAEGKDNRSGIVDLETVADLTKTRRVTVKTRLALAEGEKVIIIPLLESKMHHSNLWDAEQRQKLIEKNAWIGKLQWGPHLRCFIDPLCNETNMVNGTENLRQYTPSINRDLALWLEEKYRTEQALSAAWAIKELTFETAARLVPLRRSDNLYFADPAAGKIYRSDLNKSQAWIDYNEMIRDTYSAYADDVAIQVKKLVNVPVINKSVGVHGSREHISRKYLGWDGTGFEIYLNAGLPQEGGGGASAAEAAASGHTMWKVGTEIGHSFEVGNGKVKFFKDEQEIRSAATALAELGASGFYFFGIDLKPGNLWSDHNFQDFPAGLQWVAGIKKDFAAKPPVPTPSSYIYPAGYGWWWWTTRWQSLYDHEQNTIPQSVRISGNEWGYNTDVLPAEFKRVIVNCPFPPFSLKHGPVINGIINAGKPIVYLGERNDLGSIAELDKYFSNEKITFPDGSSAQVLKTLPGVKVLAAENGKPWAIRKDNLLIISRNPVKDKKNNADSGFKYLRNDWL